MNSKETIERIYLTKEDFIRIENEIRFQEHLRRYSAVRRFCYGKVLDFACGCGYGSYLLAANPEVSSVTGLDIDEEAVKWATMHFGHPKTSYIFSDCKKIHQEFDVLVCLETVEHVQDIQEVVALVERCQFKLLILSFPDKKSTHFNAFHFHDFVLQDLMDMFPNYILFHEFKLVDVQFVLFAQKPVHAPSHVFRNLHDLH